MAGKSSPEEYRLFRYMIGWWAGVNAAARNIGDAACPDFVAGYDDGQKAKKAAYEAASDRYGVVLSVFRAGGYEL